MNEECFNYPNLQLDPEVKAIVRYRESNWFHSANEFLRRFMSAALEIPTSQPWTDVIPPNKGRNLDESLLILVHSMDVPLDDIQFLVWPGIMKLMGTKQT